MTKSRLVLDRVKCVSNLLRKWVLGYAVVMVMDYNMLCECNNQHNLLHHQILLAWPCKIIITWYFLFLIDAIDFHSPVKLGHVMHLSARATFTSKRSMEIEVVVDARDYISGKKKKRRYVYYGFRVETTCPFCRVANFPLG